MFDGSRSAEDLDLATAFGSFASADSERLICCCIRHVLHLTTIFVQAVSTVYNKNKAQVLASGKYPSEATKFWTTGLCQSFQFGPGQTTKMPNLRDTPTNHTNPKGPHVSLRLGDDNKRCRAWPFSPLSSCRNAFSNMPHMQIFNDYNRQRRCCLSHQVHKWWCPHELKLPVVVLRKRWLLYGLLQVVPSYLHGGGKDPHTGPRLNQLPQRKVQRHNSCH